MGEGNAHGSRFLAPEAAVPERTAVQSRAHADPLFVKQVRNGFGGEIVTSAQQKRAVRLPGQKQLGVRVVCQSVTQTEIHGILLPAHRRKTVVRKVADSRAQSRNPRRVHRPRLIPIGQKRRHVWRSGHGAASAANHLREGRDLLLLPLISEEQDPRPLRTEQSLVPRHAERVRADLADGNRNMSRALRDVGNETDAALTADFPHLGKRQGLRYDIA